MRSRSWQKALASAVCVLILGAQTHQVVRGGDWYWPFTDYPMYSGAKQAGDDFRFVELRALPCVGPGSPVALTYPDLGLVRFDYYGLTNRIVDPSPTRPDAGELKDGAERLLATRIAENYPGQFCAAQLWTQTYVIGPEGLVSDRVPWELNIEWEIPRETAATRPGTTAEP